MNEKNRILVNEGKVTILLNSHREPDKKMELALRVLALTLTGVDLSNDWKTFSDGLAELNVVLMGKARNQSHGCDNR